MGISNKYAGRLLWQYVFYFMQISGCLACGEEQCNLAFRMGGIFSPGWWKVLVGAVKKVLVD